MKTINMITILTNKITKYIYNIYTGNLLISKILVLLLLFVIFFNYNIAECTAIPNYTRTSLASLNEMISMMTPEEIDAFNQRLDELNQELEREKSTFGWESVAIFVATTVCIYLITRYSDVIFELGREIAVNSIEFGIQLAKELAQRKVESIINAHGVNAIPKILNIGKEVMGNRVPGQP